MFELSVRAEFEAAHRIEGYMGKCSRLHGHSWTVEVCVAGSKTDKLGMVVDFKTIKGELRNFLKEFDHQYLNELPMFEKGCNPTAENIAKYIYEALEKKEAFQKNSQLRNVKVWESPKSAVVYSKDE
jgi:6-pyruvoyltetrahydropterin/6-carboxytetrahydropterin synthase